MKLREKGNNGVKTIKPLSPKIILEHLLLLAMLHIVVYCQVIVSNPAKYLQLQKTMKSKRKYYYDDQSKLLFNLKQLVENQIKYKVPIILIIFTGFRLCELM